MEVSVGILTSKWVMTLFSSHLTLGGLSAVWDIFFYLGWPAFLRILIQLMIYLKDVICRSTLESLSIYMKENPKGHDLDISYLLKHAKRLTQITN
jgi:hypothetical protein